VHRHLASAVVVMLLLLISAAPVGAQAARARLTLADASAIIAAAQKSAAARKVQVSIAVVDARGDLVALERQPGASGSTVDATIGKAMLSAIFLRPSGTFNSTANPASPITAVNESTGGRLRFAPGGVPIVRGGLLVGAVAVDGAAAQDEAIATDGAAAFP
jgi:uncharacterized protein GlcG (DUF336 family)